MQVKHPAVNIYARALLEVAKDADAVEAIGEELVILRDEVLSIPDARVFFESPKINRADKRDVLKKTLKGKISDTVLNFLQVLIDRGRQFQFDQIVEEYLDLVQEYSGKIHVEIGSAVPLDASSKERLVKLLSEKLNKQVTSKERVDETLLGGLTIRVGDTVVDGSLRSRLEEIREQIASQRLGSDLIDEN